MKRAIVVLSVLLAAQLVLAGGLYFAGGEEPAGGTSPLLAVEAKEVTGLTVTGPDGQSVKLAREEDGWALPAADGFPADADKAGRLVQTLAGLEAGVPVARSESALPRFKVGEESFQQRVVIRREDGDPVNLLIGESAGAGRVYARRGDSTAVREVSFQSWLASTSPDEWYASDVPAVDPAKVVRVNAPGFTLKRVDKGWMLAEPDALKGKIDAGRAAKLVTDLAQPSFQSVSRASRPEGGGTAYELVTKDGDRITFRYLDDEKSGPVFVRDDQPWVYRIKAERLTRLAGLKPQSLVADSDADSAAKASADAES